MFDSFDEMFEKESPYSKEVLDKYRKKWESGEEIPFGIAGTLKAQGIIPRADGTYKVSDDYKNAERIANMKVYASRGKTSKKVKSSKPDKDEKSFMDKLGPETKAPESHADKVEKRIHREEKKKLKRIEKPERIEKHPDSKHKGNPVDKDFEGNIKKDDHTGKKQGSIQVKKPSKKSFGGNDVSKKNYDIKPGAKKKWSSKTKLSESFMDFEEFMILESLYYSGSDVTTMPVIGKVYTKAIGPFEEAEYDIVEIIKDEKGKNYYICNFWYKSRVPQIIHQDLVEKYEPAQ